MSPPVTTGLPSVKKHIQHNSTRLLISALAELLSILYTIYFLHCILTTAITKKYQQLNRPLHLLTAVASTSCQYTNDILSHHNNIWHL